MNGELAQLVALAAHGTAYLRGAIPRPELFPAHSTFRFVAKVGFGRASRWAGLIPITRPVGEGTASWFDHLRARSAHGVELAYRPPIRLGGALAPHVDAGFSNGTHVALAVRLADGSSEPWRGAWSVSAPGAADQRIWTVAYRSAGHARGAAAPMSAREAGARLGRALGDARELALDHSWLDWAQRLEGARDQLSTAAPTIRYHDDLLPPAGYGAAARQLLAAVSAGWVLGGMGSWNDLAPRDQGRFDAVTSELHLSLIGAAVAAVRSFEAP